LLIVFTILSGFLLNLTPWLFSDRSLKDCTSGKDKEQKRVLSDYLHNLHKKFQLENSEIKILRSQLQSFFPDIIVELSSLFKNWITLFVIICFLLCFILILSFFFSFTTACTEFSSWFQCTKSVFKVNTIILITETLVIYW
jgi:hypothetical protein